MTETTQQYFEREKKSRLLLSEYLDTLSWTLSKLNVAKEILWWDVNQFVEYETDADWVEWVNLRTTDWDWIDEAVRNYYEPLSIIKYLSVDPWTNEVLNDYDAKYEIQITIGWPNVYWDIWMSAHLHLYWWSEHYDWDFWMEFASDLLSFYWLE